MDQSPGQTPVATPSGDGDRDRNQGAHAARFWFACLTPALVALGIQALIGLDWGDQRVLALLLCYLAVVFGCSCYSSFWIVTRFMETAQLRVFVGTGLVLAFSTAYVAFLVFLRYLAAWCDRGG